MRTVSWSLFLNVAANDCSTRDDVCVVTVTTPGAVDRAVQEAEDGGASSEGGTHEADGGVDAEGESAVTVTTPGAVDRAVQEAEDGGASSEGGTHEADGGVTPKVRAR
jgi:hypothetical protein